LKSESITLFTDSLSGCVAVVIANDKYVFMSHILSGSDQKTIDARAEKYLLTVIKWMRENDDGNIKIVGLTANGTNAPTFKAFFNTYRKKIPKGNIPPKLIIKKGGKCNVMLDDNDGIELDVNIVIKPYNTIGAATRSDLIEHRIDASDSNGFGFGKALVGDYDSHLSIYDIIYDLNWINDDEYRSFSHEKNFPKQPLFMAVRELCRAVGSMHNARILLQFVNEKIKPMDVLVNDEQLITICRKVIIQLKESQKGNINIENKVYEIILSVLKNPEKRGVQEWRKPSKNKQEKQKTTSDKRKREQPTSQSKDTDLDNREKESKQQKTSEKNKVSVGGSGARKDEEETKEERPPSPGGLI